MVEEDPGPVPEEGERARAEKEATWAELQRVGSAQGEAQLQAATSSLPSPHPPPGSSSPGVAVLVKTPLCWSRPRGAHGSSGATGLVWFPGAAETCSPTQGERHGTDRLPDVEAGSLIQVFGGVGGGWPRSKGSGCGPVLLGPTTAPAWDAPRSWGRSLHLTPRSTFPAATQPWPTCHKRWHFPRSDWAGPRCRPLPPSHGFALQLQGGTLPRAILPLTRDVGRSSPAPGAETTPLLEPQGTAVTPSEDPEASRFELQAVVPAGGGASPEQALQTQLPPGTWTRLGQEPSVPQSSHEQDLLRIRAGGSQKSLEDVHEIGGTRGEQHCHL
ncbi:uncharacterized protein LOC128625769 [Artibeus jamaicensis]|uniref:uncharacterized protein LOC128625769 n=1 Tax=Artibeus jamaicensis TaxID=9417 RepID=UPI00235B047F|nr:uncharacterized protein LOC128625769 [Artibeus jamaicensis]